MISSPTYRYDIEKAVSKKLKQGLDKDNILEEVNNEFGHEEEIIQVLAKAPNMEKFRKFKYLNYLLIALISYAGLIKIIPIVLSIADFSPKSILILLILPILNIYLVIFISFHRQWAYILCAYLYFQSFIKILDIPLARISIFNTIIVLATIFLSIFLRIKLFPHFGLILPKIDEKGNSRYQ